MRILHIYKDYYPPTCGGIEIAINRIIEATRDQCEEISVLICSRNPKTEFAEVEGTPVYKVGEWGRFMSAPVSPTYPFWLWKLKADILHYHIPNPTAVLSHLMVRPKGKLVVHYHSDIVRQKNFMPFYQPFRQRFLAKADAIIASSPNYMESSEDLQPFLHKITIIPFGIPISRFTRSPELNENAHTIRKRYGERLILFVGILRYYKGIEYLIRAMKHVNGKLLIVGTGPLLPDLIEQAELSGYKDRIVFVGQVESVIPYYFASTVFCLPSIYRSEAFGLVLTEAAASGLPLISTDIGTGTSYINRHQETGLVVPPCDEMALSEAINRILNHTELQNLYGAAARKRAERLFSVETMGQNILNLYKNILK